MQTSSSNKAIMDKISYAYELISERKYMEAEKFLDEVDALTKGRAQGISRARMIIAKGKRNEKN